jgi:HAD superfamily phosphoserine phosphatase-like hydrolase
MNLGTLPGIVLFDFDDTLIRGDSMPRFLDQLFGWPRVRLAMVAVADAAAAARRLAPRLRWLRPQLEALRAHAAAGRRVVVVSGALDVYLGILLEGLPVSDILATGVEVKDGRLTGRLAGPNCVRIAKAECIRAFLAAQAPTGPTWGYGNRPHDLPMLALVDHPAVI